jgi:ornithine cyclodeaminase/alanine dehydrogenase-like protein (mu-crystallin family)
MFFMPAHVFGQRTVSAKVARVNRENSKNSLPTVLLTIYTYDARTGVQVAELEGEWLTAVRTAASTAVATNILARKTVKVLGIFGTGLEARAHVPALKLVRDFDKILVYSRNRRNRELFVKRMSRNSAVPVLEADSRARVASEADIIITATTSDTPVFDGRLVAQGTHVNAIGSATPEAREVDAELVGRSRVVVDSREQALATYGDVIWAIKDRAIRKKDIHELGNILIGRSRIVRRPDEITLFKSGGLAVLDAVLANYIIGRLSGERLEARPRVFHSGRRPRPV